MPCSSRQKLTTPISVPKQQVLKQTPITTQLRRTTTTTITHLPQCIIITLHLPQSTTTIPRRTTDRIILRIILHIIHRIIQLQDIRIPGDHTTTTRGNRKWQVISGHC
ncbi:uncharacterized protein [Diadema antillarum]|uniref:uncharacterized protein n=1 Tax=Diadema antillarum TaxID=105358 RepID=UPI003A87CC60